MCGEVEKLERRINQMRESLILIAVETGLNSDDTIYYSQKLDDLLRGIKIFFKKWDLDKLC
jgi:stage 0 sporulation regulatory protein